MKNGLKITWEDGLNFFDAESIIRGLTMDNEVVSDGDIVHLKVSAFDDRLVGDVLFDKRTKNYVFASYENFYPDDDEKLAEVGKIVRKQFSKRGIILEKDSVFELKEAISKMELIESPSPRTNKDIIKGFLLNHQLNTYSDINEIYPLFKVKYLCRDEEGNISDDSSQELLQALKEGLEDLKEDDRALFRYGMKNRAYGAGTFPESAKVVEVINDALLEDRKYHSLVICSEALSSEQIGHFELEDISFMEKGGDDWVNIEKTIDYLISKDKEKLYLSDNFYKQIGIDEEKFNNLVSKNGYRSPTDLLKDKISSRKIETKEVVTEPKNTQINP